MFIPDYSIQKDCICYSRISLLGVQYYLSTYKQGLFYATLEEVACLEAAYPRITFWLLPNDNVFPGFSKYLAVIDSILQ